MVGLAIWRALGLLEASMLKYKLLLLSYQDVAVIMITIWVLAYLLCKCKLRMLLCYLRKDAHSSHDQLPDN